MDFMPFGKHKGSLISDIPTSYLEWGSTELSGGVQRQFVAELLSRKEQLPFPVAPEPHAPKSTSCGSWDCSSQFDANATWPEAQPWDGSTPPWEDQFGYDDLSKEFLAIVG